MYNMEDDIISYVQCLCAKRPLDSLRPFILRLYIIYIYIFIYLNLMFLFRPPAKTLYLA